MISALHIENFRNIKTCDLSLSSQFNLFYGENGAGKTSLLEAIYYLATAKSFRTQLVEKIIHYEMPHLLVSAAWKRDQTSSTVGIQRDKNSVTAIHVNQQSVRSIAAVSAELPIQLIGAESHRLLTDGPKVRRQFLDWGLFYTDPLFFSTWKQFQKLLMQRNAALKARASRDELLAWNKMFAEVALLLHTCRKNYIHSFLDYFYRILEKFLPNQIISFQYAPGWDENAALNELLDAELHKELQIGHTLHGPHRADLLLSVNNFPIHDIFSQGQLKLTAYALKLAQGIHVQSVAEKTPIFLIDDLPSELDSCNQRLVMEMLSTIHAQVFMTGIQFNELRVMLEIESAGKMFHVEQSNGIANIAERAVEECFT